MTPNQQVHLTGIPLALIPASDRIVGLLPRNLKPNEHVMSELEENIKKRLYKYSKEIFGFDFDVYLTHHARSLYGITINPSIKQFEHMFGEIPDNFLATINQQFHDTIAGYRVDVGAHFKTLGINADVFLLNKNNLNGTPKDTDALIIHELCHMLIDSNYLHSINFVVGPMDISDGNKLYKKTDVENIMITRHDQNFCQLLAAAGEIAQKKLDCYNDRWDFINSAMRYDMLGSLRSK